MTSVPAFAKGSGTVIAPSSRRHLWNGREKAEINGDADNNISRRTLLKAVAVAAGVSLASTFTVTACSAKATKAAMEYQNKPQDGEQCSNCRFFIPGKTPKANGTCQVVRGSISPHGWCTAYAEKTRPGGL
ncbi:MAG: high-potential iron-sulfur protein [Candidatus Sulfobium sp.]|jgi:hypothetical protein